MFGKLKPIKSVSLCNSCEYGYYNKCLDGCDIDCHCHDLDNCYCNTIKNGEKCERYKPSRNGNSMNGDSLNTTSRNGYSQSTAPKSYKPRR